MPDAQTNAPSAHDSPLNGAEWVSVARFASLEGISPKTVWRRAKSGQLEARKVAGGRGGFVWEIALNPTGQPTDRPDKTDRTPSGQSEGDKPVLRSEPTGQPDKTERPTDRTATGQTDEVTARLLAHLERENAFLRASVEQHQRSEAELRAALREALKIAPRQLSAAPDTTAINRQQDTQNGAPDNMPDAIQTAPEPKQNGEEMDARELLELCRRISR